MASRFWVGGTGTWDAADTTHWAATSGGAGGASVPVAADTVTFDASSGGGTVTVSHASLSITSLAFGAFTGTLDFATNNNNVTAGSVAGTGTGTRTFNMGNGTWTLTLAAGNFWDMTTTTNLTFNANGSTIIASATGTSTRTFNGGGLTYNNVTINNAAVNGRQINVAGSNTFANLTLTNTSQVVLSNGTTQTISGTLTFNGSPTSVGFLGTAGTNATISVANATTLSWLSIANITKAGAGSITAVNSFDGGGNSGITISPPGRVFAG
jgi:hypothetical protein